MLKEIEHSKQKGLVGITTAIQYFTEQGYTVLMPLVDANKYDLVLELDGKFSRVQVKTSSYEAKNTTSSCYNVILESRGGAGGKIRTALSQDDFDILFVLTDDKRRWVIPMEKITATTALTVGSKKFSEYEV